MSSDGRLLTAGELAARLRVTRQTVYRHARAGDFPVVRLGAGPRAPLRFDPIDVDRALSGGPR